MPVRYQKAILDDPSAPPIYRTSGDAPYPAPGDALPETIGAPRRVTLRDRITTATLVPFSSPSRAPLSLLVYLCAQINREIEKGDTYPMTAPMTLDFFGAYWFANFAAVMLLGDWGESVEQAYQRLSETQREGGERDWERECLGSFYVKPNYPGRSSHVCNGGFLVTDGARNRGVGRLMGEGYLEWAPKLGYTYSVFNLVYETNVASCRIWDALGFKRIGRVRGCGNLKSYDEPVDAIIYGRELTPTVPEDSLSEERFDKIKFYLKHQRYPDGADRAEKSRLRSAATHYRLVIEPGATEDEEPSEKLFLKDKEVISDLETQTGIARQTHLANGHAGINKTTGAIAERYHWVRIKDTASLVIKECPTCSEAAGKQAAAAQQAAATASGGGVGARQAVDGMANGLVGGTSPPSEAQDAHMLDSDFTLSSLSDPLQQTRAAAGDHHALTIDHLGYEVPVDPQILSGYAEFGGAAEDASGAGMISDDLLREHLVDDAFGQDRPLG